MVLKMTGIFISESNEHEFPLEGVRKGQCAANIKSGQITNLDNLNRHLGHGC
jgi:hypothetical protein